MKDKILELREQGKTYLEIKDMLNCSLSTISYYCGVGQKAKTLSRTNKRNKKNVLRKKVELFKSRTLSEKCRSFQRRDGYKFSEKENNFTVSDLVKKLGENPKCYLTGREIDLQQGNSYHLDHVIPSCRGGKNTLENANILDSTVNKMKHNLTPEEFISKCKQILEYQGFKVTKENC